MDYEGDVKRLKEIIMIAKEYTPIHLNGLLIPDNLLYEFFQLIRWICERSIDAKKYFEQIMDTANASQKTVTEFVTLWCEKIADGSIKINE